MTVLVDENVHRGVTEAIRSLEHEVVDVSELSPGIADTDVLALAVER